MNALELNQPQCRRNQVHPATTPYEQLAKDARTRPAGHCAMVNTSAAAAAADTTRFNNLELFPRPKPTHQSHITAPATALSSARLLLRAFGYDCDGNPAISSGQAADIVRDTNADAILAELQTELSATQKQIEAARRPDLRRPRTSSSAKHYKTILPVRNGMRPTCATPSLLSPAAVTRRPTAGHPLWQRNPPGSNQYGHIQGRRLQAAKRRTKLPLHRRRRLTAIRRPISRHATAARRATTRRWQYSPTGGLPSAPPPGARQVAAA